MEYYKNKLNSLAKKHGIKMILLFGSRAQGNSRQDSDLDLGILFTDVPLDLAPIISDLITIFKNYSIDLAVLNHSDPVF